MSRRPSRSVAIHLNDTRLGLFSVKLFTFSVDILWKQGKSDPYIAGSFYNIPAVCPVWYDESSKIMPSSGVFKNE